MEANGRKGSGQRTVAAQISVAAVDARRKLEGLGGAGSVPRLPAALRIVPTDRRGATVVAAARSAREPRSQSLGSVHSISDGSPWLQLASAQPGFQRYQSPVCGSGSVGSSDSDPQPDDIESSTYPPISKAFENVPRTVRNSVSWPQAKASRLSSANTGWPKIALTARGIRRGRAGIVGVGDSVAIPVRAALFGALPPSDSRKDTAGSPGLEANRPDPHSVSQQKGSVAQTAAWHAASLQPGPPGAPQQSHPACGPGGSHSSEAPLSRPSPQNVQSGLQSTQQARHSAKPPRLADADRVPAEKAAKRIDAAHACLARRVVAPHRRVILTAIAGRGTRRVAGFAGLHDLVAAKRGQRRRRPAQDRQGQYQSGQDDE